MRLLLRSRFLSFVNLPKASWDNLEIWFPTRDIVFIWDREGNTFVTSRIRFDSRRSRRRLGGRGRGIVSRWLSFNQSCWRCPIREKVSSSMRWIWFSSRMRVSIFVASMKVSFFNSVKLFRLICKYRTVSVSPRGTWVSPHSERSR